jgi:hypothetical protein
VGRIRPGKHDPEGLEAVFDAGHRAIVVRRDALVPPERSVCIQYAALAGCRRAAQAEKGRNVCSATVGCW